MHFSPGAESTRTDETTDERHTAATTENHSPIAIVGVGLRFPGGNNTLDEFDDFLREGRSGITAPTTDRWDVDAFTSDDPEAKGKIRTTGVGFLDGIDQFDAPFFNISPLEAQFTDPQQRLLLETTWEALENANINPTQCLHGNCRLGHVHRSDR